MLLLSVIGVVFIYSAQSYVGGTQWESQILWMLIGVGIYLAVSFADYAIFMKYSHWVWIIAVLLLLLIFTPLGDSRMGARRWIDL